MKRLLQIPGKLSALPFGDRPPMTVRYATWSFISGTVGILAIYWIADLTDQSLLIGSFGASAVLLFGANDSPLAQPRNILGGHVFSALVAVCVVATIGVSSYSIAVAVGLAILIMNLTHTTHPPGGATALIGVQSGASLKFILFPVLTGALVLLIVALLTNNFVYHRRYPKHWL